MFDYHFQRRSWSKGSSRKHRIYQKGKDTQIKLFERVFQHTQKSVACRTCKQMLARIESLNRQRNVSYKARYFIAGNDIYARVHHLTEWQLPTKSEIWTLFESWDNKISVILNDFWFCNMKYIQNGTVKCVTVKFSVFFFIKMCKLGAIVVLFSTLNAVDDIDLLRLDNYITFSFREPL